jgi:hypothetical protein
MTKTDYIHLFKEACGGRCNAEYNPCAFRQAANSLAALKPVAWVKSTESGYNTIGYESDVLNQLSNETELYALETKNESA